MKSLVTTGAGDHGATHCIGGDKISKNHPIIACSGWLDTVRAQTARFRLTLIEAGPERYEDIAEVLFWVLHCLFVIGTECSDPARKHPEYRHTELGPDHLARLETEQARLETTIELPRAFIVSATSQLSAELDVLATQTRHFERHLVQLKEAVPEFNGEHLLPFANRLGDFFYVLARYLEDREHEPVDYTVLDE